MECSILQTDSQGRIVPVELLPYKSIVWEEGWQASGTVQAVFVRSDYVLEAVKIGRWLGLDISDKVMYIHSIKITDTEVWAYGYEAKELLAKCALMQQQPAGAVDIAATMEAVISDNCSYSWLGSVDVYGLSGDTANLDSLEYLSIAEYVDECAKLKRLGYWLTRNTATNKLDFSANVGTNKTNQVRFSTTLGNARDVRYTKNDKSYCNKVYAVGSDGIVETAEESPIVGETYSAILDLRESFPKDEDVTEAEYREALQTKAHMSLIARHTTEKIEIGDIDTNEYGTAYGLGDIVTVDIPDLYLTTTRRVTMARYTIEGGNITLKLTLSEA